LQILRHTSLLPGQFPGLTGQMTGRLAALVTKPTTTAEPLVQTAACTDNSVNIQIISLFGGAAIAHTFNQDGT